MTALGGRFSAFERSTKLMAVIKLLNVGLTMITGFAVTYVFIRTLPLDTFRAFLLLVAFGNFTVSAEFGLTSIIYSRLRRYWLASDGDAGREEFRLEEIGFLFLFLIGLVAVAALALAGALATGWVRTGYPLLFQLFFVNACLNVVLLLMKRGLAAVDTNFGWEAIDFLRRVATLALLMAILLGLNITLSVALQLALALATMAASGLWLQRRLGMRKRQWLAWRSGGRHVRRYYSKDIGTTVALTISEMAAYNAPYFTIAAATHDVRPMLLFDFTFKMMRALSMIVRALIEATMPKLTAAYYERRSQSFVRVLRLSLLASVGAAAGGALVLLVAGRWLVDHLFDGKLDIRMPEIVLVGVMMVALSVTSVSVYLQGALGRFGVVLRQSIPFVTGSLLCVPAAALLIRGTGYSFSIAFLTLYALVFLGTAALHAVSIRRLVIGLRAPAGVGA